MNKKFLSIACIASMILGLSLVSCEIMETGPKKKVVKKTVTKVTGGYGEEAPATGGYGEEAPATGGDGGEAPATSGGRRAAPAPSGYGLGAPT